MYDLFYFISIYIMYLKLRLQQLCNCKSLCHWICLLFSHARLCFIIGSAYFYVALDSFSIVNFYLKKYALEHKGLLFPCMFINNNISLLGWQIPFTVFSVVKKKN